jgi:ABC-2 type transport system permease protein
MTTTDIAYARRGALRQLTRTELRLFLREKVGPAFGVGFPIALLIVFHSIPYFTRPLPVYGGLTLLDVYVPILVAFVIAMLAVNLLPPTLAGYRERGILRRLRTTPVGPVRVLAAQLVVNVTTIAVSITSVLLISRYALGVPLPRQFAGFLVAAVLATAALIAIGLFVAASAPTGRIANAIGATLFYVFMTFAGLWIPIQAMPSLLRHISRATPLGAAVTALQDASNGHWPPTLQLVTLAAYAIVAGVGAALLFRWE